MQVVLSVTVMFVDLYVTIVQVTVFKVSAALTQMTLSGSSMWVTIFIVIKQVGVSVATMHMLFSAVHYAHYCFYCSYPGNCLK